MPTDSELLNQIRHRNLLAFKKILAKHQIPLYQYFVFFTEDKKVAIKNLERLFLEVVMASKKRSVRKQFSHWLYHRARQLSQHPLTQNQQDISPIQKKMYSLHLEEREILFFKEKLNFSWDLIQKIERHSIAQIKRTFLRALNQLCPELENRTPMKEECFGLNRDLADFLYPKSSDSNRKNHRIHIKSCSYCHTRIKTFQEQLVEINNVALPFPPSWLSRSIEEQAEQSLLLLPVGRRSPFILGMGLIVILIGFGFYQSKVFHSKNNQPETGSMQRISNPYVPWNPEEMNAESTEGTPQTSHQSAQTHQEEINAESAEDTPQTSNQHDQMHQEEINVESTEDILQTTNQYDQMKQGEANTGSMEAILHTSNQQVQMIPGETDTGSTERILHTSNEYVSMIQKEENNNFQKDHNPTDEDLKSPFKDSRRRAVKDQTPQIKEVPSKTGLLSNDNIETDNEPTFDEPHICKINAEKTTATGGVAENSLLLAEDCLPIFKPIVMKNQLAQRKDIVLHFKEMIEPSESSPQALRDHPKDFSTIEYDSQSTVGQFISQVAFPKIIDQPSRSQSRGSTIDSLGVVLTVSKVYIKREWPEIAKMLFPPLALNLTRSSHRARFESVKEFRAIRELNFGAKKSFNLPNEKFLGPIKTPPKMIRIIQHTLEGPRTILLKIQDLQMTQENSIQRKVLHSCPVL